MFRVYWFYEFDDSRVKDVECDGLELQAEFWKFSENATSNETY